jgi:hypothetical protein
LENPTTDESAGEFVLDNFAVSEFHIQKNNGLPNLRFGDHKKRKSTEEYSLKFISKEIYTKFKIKIYTNLSNTMLSQVLLKWGVREGTLPHCFTHLTRY